MFKLNEEKFKTENNIEYELLISKGSRKFIKKHQNLINEDILKDLSNKAIDKFNGFENNVDLGPLHGKLEGKFRIRYRDIRIILEYFEDEIQIIEIQDIQLRGDVYKKK